MNFIKNPNLPKRNVKVAIVDRRIGEYKASLEALGITLIFTMDIKELGTSVSSHPDMQILHVGDNDFFILDIATNYYRNEIENICGTKDCETFNNRGEVVIKKGVSLEYPYDTTLNLALTNQWVIGLENNEIYKSLSLPKIKTRQGYSKCSVCVVQENAIITSDLSIAKSAGDFGIDVCIVSNDSIQLHGYNNGFIGGCTGKISEDKIVFYGSVDKHPDAYKIKTFTNKYDVECVSLSNKPLYDYGSLLPIVED